MEDGMDFDVLTMVGFRLGFDGGGEMNPLSLPKIQQGFVNHVKEVFKQNNTLWDNISGNLHFQFDGTHVTLEYMFCCHDEDAAEAESFSAYCVREVQKELEAFGCKIGSTFCEAAEADTTWRNQLEDADDFESQEESVYEQQDEIEMT